MSHNQSKIESQSRRPGRSGGVAGQTRGFPGGGGGRGGGGFAPPVPAPVHPNAAAGGSLPAGRSFKKPGNGQPTATPQVGLASSSPSVLVGNGLQNQHSSQVPGTPASSMQMASKQVEVSAPKPSRPAPRPPSSQPSLGSLDSTTPAVTAKGDVNKQFTLQFGSIAPGFVNGMPIPARTSSAPPNLDEQKKDQASRGMYATPVPTVPVPVVSKQQAHPPTKEAIGSTQVSSGISHPPPIEAKKDNAVQISTPHSMLTQKSAAVSVPGLSMPIFTQQTQMPLQFGGPNIQLQSQHVPPGSLQMSITQMPIGNSPSIYVPGPHVVLPGQGLSYPSHIGHRVASGMGNVGIGMATQYSQQQTGQFGSSRKTTVKITHPVTHEELRLDKKTDSHVDTSVQRSNIPSQTQPPPFPSPQFFQNPQGTYPPNLYYTSHPHPQPTVSQAPRFNFPVAQSGTPISIVNPSTLASVPVNISVPTFQKESEHLHLGHSQGVKVSVSAPPQVQVTVKPAPSIATNVGTPSAGPGAVVVKDGGSRLAKPLQEASLMSQPKASVGSVAPSGQLKSLGSELELPSVHLSSSAKSTIVASVPAENNLLPAFSSGIDKETGSSDQKVGSCALTLDPSPVNESISLTPLLATEKKELTSSDSPEVDKKNIATVDRSHFLQDHMACVLDSSSTSSALPANLDKDNYSSTQSDDQVHENHEHSGFLSKTNDMPVEDGCSSETGASMIKGDKSHVTTVRLGITETENGVRDAFGESIGEYSITNGDISKKGHVTRDFGVALPCLEVDVQLDLQESHGTKDVAETSESNVCESPSFRNSQGTRDLVSLDDPSQDKNLPNDNTEKDNPNHISAPVQLVSDNDIKIAGGEVSGDRQDSGIELKEVSVDIQSNCSVGASIKLSGNEPKTGSGPVDISSTNHPKSPPQTVISAFGSSDKSLNIEDSHMETGGQVSRSSSMAKDRASSEATRTKLGAGKRRKKKDMLIRADAAGPNSDLYLAYKGPEEQQIAAIPSDNADSSSVDGLNNMQADEVDDTITKEDGPSKIDIDDWEALEIPGPKLEVQEESGHSDMAKKLGLGHGTVSSKNKYSRDFLLKLLDQFTDLPVGFEIGPDIAPLLSVQVGSSHYATNEMHPGNARIIDRPNPSSRVDRRTMNYLDDEKWAKSASLPSSRDGGHGANFRAGSGASHGVLRNPKGQGGILSGQMQPLVAPGAARNNVDGDRWQRASRGLIPSPQTPAQVMHKAEKKYEVGKISDEEEAKQRQIKGILNKLTPQNFDRLFQQVKEVNIDNATTLTRVISQIFDKALAEPTFCEMYANFCFHLAGALPDFKEDNEKITFKRLLLNKCQEEFERGEREQAEADKVGEEGEAEQSEEAKEEKRIRARRRMLGNIRLIGELYKKKMLTERIMHECIKKLLGENQNPDEEDIEALCKLMSTIGEIIDHVKAKDHMDSYFFSMKNLSENHKLSSRVRFMLKDAIDLRRNSWQQRRKVEGPKKIEEVHRDAAQERAHVGRSARGSGMGTSSRKGPPSDYSSRSSISSSAQQSASLRSIPTLTRGFGSQDVRVEEKHLYESRTLSVPLSQRTMGDDAITLGPQGGLARGMSSRGQPLMPNPPNFDTPSIAGESRRIGLGPNGHGSVSDRNVFVGIRDIGRSDRIHDRSSSKSSVDQTMGSTGSGGSSPQSVSFSEEQLRDKCISTIREYYSAKDEKEVGLCIKELNSPNFYPSMVSLWVTDSFERKDIERELLSKLLVNLCKSSDNVLSKAQLIEGFELVLSNLEDAITDAPRAAEFVGRIFVGAFLGDVLPFAQIGRLLQEGGEEPGRLLEVGLAGDVLGNVLEIIRTEKGDAALNELRRNSSPSLESFRPPHPYKSRKLEHFL